MEEIILNTESEYKDKEKIDRLAIRLPKDLKRNFQAHCKNNMLNSSEVVRSLLEKYLKEAATKAKDNKKD